MGFFARARDRAVGVWLGGTVGANAISESIQHAREVAEEALIRSQENPPDKWVREGIAELELAMEDGNWREMTAGGSWNFSRSALRRMMGLSRIMYLINPLIKRAVTVQELYVWGSGCTIKATDTSVQEVLDDFFNDPKNQAVVGSNWPEREREQRIDGNTFLLFFQNRINGTSRVRLLPVDQVEDIICNPDDSKEPWFYKRVFINVPTDGQEVGDVDGSTILFPDIDYNPAGLTRPNDYQGIPIKWDARVLHIKTGALSTMKFGVPELFSVLNWATAYKKILENFATILSAYARVAMKVAGLPGKKGTAGAKAKLGTAISGGSATVDTNPPPNTAAWMALSGNVDISAVKTANSTTGPDEARALRSMVAAGSDTPEHFFGDSDIGNFATSSTLDRPTELKMVSRQKMWNDIILRICNKMVEWSAVAPRGKLRLAGYSAVDERDPFDNTKIWRIKPPKDRKSTVTVTFPSIIERDVVERVRAVVQAATLNGSKAEGIIPDRKLLFKMLMVALGQKNVDELTEELYPESVKQGFVDPEKELKIKSDKAQKAQKQGVTKNNNEAT